MSRSRFGQTAGATGGYEEWAVKKTPQPTLVTTVQLQNANGTETPESTPLPPASPTQLPLNSIVKDSSVLTPPSGSKVVPTGTVTYTFFNNLTCSDTTAFPGIIWNQTVTLTKTGTVP